MEQLLNFCRGLNVMNLCPEIQIDAEDIFRIYIRLLGIYSKNRPEWLYAYFCDVRDSITIVI